MLCLSLYIILNLIRANLQVLLYAKDITNNRFVYWDTFIGTLLSVSIVISILCIKINNHRIQNIINYIGHFTFYIYLIHVAVYTKMNRLSVSSRIYNLIVTKNGCFAQELLYTIFYALSVFIVSLIVSITVSMLHNYFKYVYYQHGKWRGCK